MKSRLLSVLGVLGGASLAHAGLVAHFPLDLDGNSADGTYVATLNENVTYGGAGANANTGTSAAFNGASSRIQHDWNTALNPVNFTLTLWAQSNGGPGTWNSPVTSRRDLNPDSEGYLIYDSQPTGSWTFWSGNGTDAGNWQTLDGPTVLLGEWQHIAITYNDSIQQKELFVDGVSVGTMDTRVAPNGGTPLNIGAGQDFGDGFWFNGNIDDIGLWDEVLSPERIRSVAANGIPEPTTALLLGLAGAACAMRRRR